MRSFPCAWANGLRDSNAVERCLQTIPKDPLFFLETNTRVAAQAPACQVKQRQAIAGRPARNDSQEVGFRTGSEG